MKNKFLFLSPYSWCMAWALLLLSWQSVAATLFDLPETSMNEVKQGQFLFRGDGDRYFMAPTLETKVSMSVTGLIARCVVEQKFTNSTDQWVEGVYVFPLPEDAAVDHMNMIVGERIIQGLIKEREQARRVYEQAKSRGQKAALVEQQRPNMFTNSVANIAPGESLTVTIEYQQTLRYDQGRFALRFPMAITPRYIPGRPTYTEEQLQTQGNGWALNTDQVGDASAITPPVVRPVEGQVNPVSLAIELNSGFPLQEVKSRYHPVTAQRLGVGHYQVSLAAGTVPSDRDFELTWTPKPGKEPRAALFTQQKEGETYQMLMVMPPNLQVQTTVLGKEVIYIIDTSGSMGGTSIEQARQSLLLALSRLRSQDWFNVIQFNSTTDSLFPAAVPADYANLETAKNYVRSLQAGGGTEMASALRAALQQNVEHSSRVRQVIFLTDGSVGNERALFTLIKQHLGSSRLFTVGIGSAPNSFFMTKAAQFGRGTFTYIGDLNEVQEKMSNLFSKLETPVMADIRVEFDGANATAAVEQFPQRIPDLYAGEPIMLVLRSTAQEQSLVIKGKQGQQHWKVNLDNRQGADDSGVAVHWARRKIASLMDSLSDGEDKDSIRQQVVDVALKHHLVSRYTSLVAVDVTPVRPADESLKRTDVAGNLPQGQQYEKIFGAMPRTAAEYELQLGLGLLLLICALGMLGLSVRKQRIEKRGCHA
ncbi:MAG: marine proteobacterial sortase target protein [Gammaproteobacteria bacterium]|nr:marine proteobacterial sortase target protein [Gammaproteobacteria bacterium]MDH5801465.1 marine proteobacterial sortase target protein [Gammaproteobacteria bacterium]